MMKNQIAFIIFFLLFPLFSSPQSNITDVILRDTLKVEKIKSNNEKNILFQEFENKIKSIEVKAKLLNYFLIALSLILLSVILWMYLIYIKKIQPYEKKLEQISQSIKNNCENIEGLSNKYDSELIRKIPEIFSQLEYLQNKLKTYAQGNQCLNKTTINDDSIEQKTVEKEANNLMQTLYFNIYSNGFNLDSGDKVYSGKSIFKVQLIDKNNAIYEINDDKDVQRYALSYFKALCEDVCSFSEYPNENKHTKIITTIPGKLKLNDNRHFVLEQKAAIIFS